MKPNLRFNGASRVLTVVLLTLATVTVLAGCGSTSTSGADSSSSGISGIPFTVPTPQTAVPSPTPSPQQEYALLVDYLNSAIVVYGSATGVSGLTPQQLTAAAGPLDTQFKAFDAGLLAYTWPANTEADVNKLVQLDQVVEADLAQAAAGSITQSNLLSWINKQNSDFNVTQAQAKIVRGDLGLGLS